jgi:hypothetical protein
MFKNLTNNSKNIIIKQWLKKVRASLYLHKLYFKN